MSGGAVFLDRDGTLIADPGYLGHPDGVRLLPGVREAMAWLQPRFRLFLFSNQSGLGRGYFSLADARAVNDRMESLLGLTPPIFSAICMPPEPPGVPSAYRKPSPRFILETMAAFRLSPELCWMVGDKASDVAAAHAAGIHAVWLQEAAPPDPDGSTWVVPDLAAFVRRLAGRAPA